MYALSRPARRLLPDWSATVDDFPVALAISRDGSMLAVGAADGRISAFDSSSGQLRWRADAHQLGVQTLAFGDGVLASGGQDGQIRLWRLGSGEAIASLKAGTGLVQHLQWSTDGRKLIWAAGKRWRMVDRGGTAVADGEHPESAITVLGFSPDGQWLAIGGTAGLALHPAAEPGKGRIFMPRKLPLLTLAWADDSRIVACGTGASSVHFWRVATGEESRMSGLGTQPFRGAPLTWVGSRLAIAALDAIVLWDFAGCGPEGAAPVQLDGHRADISHLAVDRSRRLLASADGDGRVMLWKPGQSREAQALAEGSGEIAALCWHPNRDVLLVADGSGTIQSFPVRPSR